VSFSTVSTKSEASVYVRSVSTASRAKSVRPSGANVTANVPFRAASSSQRKVSSTSSTLSSTMS
jgi:hypothetical protein